MREDDFLRSLLETVAINLTHGTLDYGLRLVRHRIDDRLKALKPVAYDPTTHDMSAGLSTTGILICGDAKSIRAVQNALHYSAQIDEYRKAFNDRLAEMPQGKVTRVSYEAHLTFFDKKFATEQEAREWAGNKLVRLIKITTLEEEIKL